MIVPLTFDLDLVSLFLVKLLIGCVLGSYVVGWV